ncbi:MAG: hypothetical protein V7739_00680 [Motiliproteus sp.]
MKTKKLIALVKGFFDDEQRTSEKKREALKEVLEKLKLKEKTLISRLEQIQDDSERADLEKKINLIHSQRKKGLKLLKEDDL